MPPAWTDESTEIVQNHAKGRRRKRSRNPSPRRMAHTKCLWTIVNVTRPAGNNFVRDYGHLYSQPWTVFKIVLSWKVLKLFLVHETFMDQIVHHAYEIVSESVDKIMSCEICEENNVHSNSVNPL